MAEMTKISMINVHSGSGKLILSVEFSIIDELMQLLSKKSSAGPEAEIMDPEDMPGKSDKKLDKEGAKKLRERLKVDEMIEQEDASKRFVELVFRELCQRDADFCRIMTEKAFEEVCLSVFRYQRDVTKKLSIRQYINMVFDNIETGSKPEKCKNVEDVYIKT